MNDGVTAYRQDSNAAFHAEPQLTGCPWHDVNEMLQAVGLRPTRQRMALGWLLSARATVI